VEKFLLIVSSSAKVALQLELFNLFVDLTELRGIERAATRDEEILTIQQLDGTQDITTDTHTTNRDNISDSVLGELGEVAGDEVDVGHFGTPFV